AAAPRLLQQPLGVHRVRDELLREERHQQRAHHDVDAAEPVHQRADPGPRPARQHRRDHRDHQQRRARDRQPQPDEGAGEGADEHLALLAEVEHPGADAHARADRDQQQRRRVQQRRADGRRVGEAPVVQGLHDLARRPAGQAHQRRRHRQRQRDGDHGGQRHLDPAGTRVQRRGEPPPGLVSPRHAATPPTSMPSRSEVASAVGSRPVMRPREMTAMRADSAMISSSSVLISRTATPPDAALRSRRYMTSIAPTSRPWVGWAATSTDGCADLSRARASRGWPPPDGPRARLSSDEVMMLISSASRRASSRLLRRSTSSRPLTFSSDFITRLSATLMSRTTPEACRSSGTMPRPALCSAPGLAGSTRTPPISTVPAEGSTRPDSRSPSAAWPLPSTPYSPRISPGATSRLRSSSSGTPSETTVTPDS